VRPELLRLSKRGNNKNCQPAVRSRGLIPVERHRDQQWRTGPVHRSPATEADAGLTLVDRFFGLLFGFVRGAFVLVVLSTLGALTGAQETQAWQASAIRPVLEQGTGLIRSWLPESWAKQFNAISMTDRSRSAGG